MKIGILGLGKMGEALVRGIQASGGFKLEATTRSGETAKSAAKRLKIAVHTDNDKLAKSSDVILLCVKPHQAEKVVTGIAKQLRKNQLLISVVTAVTNAQLEKWTGGRCAVIRSMPNTPAFIRQGMTVLAPGAATSPKQTAAAEKVFACVGRTAVVEEHLMDGVTGLSGCGPAYVYLIIEALSEAGVKVGLPRDTATLLAAQTLMGASTMVLERGDHPAALKDEVTTPAGCTIDGLMALEEGALRATLIKGVVAAANRSAKLRS